MRLQRLLSVCKLACDVVSPMVNIFYHALNSETSKLKADASVFTIADGIVQNLFVNYLYKNKFHAIVGEEDDTNINILNKPYFVEDLKVPDEFIPIVDSVRDQIIKLSQDISDEEYKDLTVFIDPIDGTREFATNLGDQCSICIGFADIDGKVVGGIVYRPITSPATWAAGCASENYFDSVLNYAEVSDTKGLLTSNGSISKFIDSLMSELEYHRVPSGGAGNKMLMLLEGKGGAYIQDRGVSRWDTCAAQAVLEAKGGILSKLTTFILEKKIVNYTYKQSYENLDFDTGVANLTPYNVKDKKLIKKGEIQKAIDVNDVKIYSNLCGLLALNQDAVKDLEHIYEGLQRAKSSNEPSYD